jgi:restriction system protein
MQQNDPNPAAELLKSTWRVALRVASVPFSWPAVVLRRSRESMSARGRSAERAKFNTRTWTPELLKRLEWRRFEELCAAYFEVLGFTTHVTLSPSGGAADIGLCAAGAGTLPITVLAHCKPWDPYRVGIKPLRELRAAMTAAGVGEGVLASSSRFTNEAVAFAAKEHIDLIDGAALLGKLADLPPEKALALLKFATQGDFLTPTCPACSIKMVERKSTNDGRTFWGCLNYPRCKQTFVGSTPA